MRELIIKHNKKRVKGWLRLTKENVLNLNVSASQVNNELMQLLFQDISEVVKSYGLDSPRLKKNKMYCGVCGFEKNNLIMQNNQVYCEDCYEYEKGGE